MLNVIRSFYLHLFIFLSLFLCGFRIWVGKCCSGGKERAEEYQKQLEAKKNRKFTGAGTYRTDNLYIIARMCISVYPDTFCKLSVSS